MNFLALSFTLCAMRCAILIMNLFMDDFPSPYLPIPSSPHLHFDGTANFFMDHTNISDKVKDKDSTPFRGNLSTEYPKPHYLSSVRGFH